MVMKRWILLIGCLAWAGVVMGQEEVVDDPFADLNVDASEVDPFAVAGKDAPGCGGCEEADPFAAEDTDGPEYENDDPFASDWSGGLEAGKIPARRLAEKRTTLRVRLETWEIDAKEVARGLDELDGVAGLEAARRELLEDDGSRLVFSPVLALEEKSRAESGSIMERIYPTEAEPPEPVQVVSAEPVPADERTLGGVVSELSMAATPTAFETRNTGVSFEAAVQPVAAEGGCWDLSIRCEEVRLVAMEPQGAEALGIKMPAVSCFTTGGLLRVREGEWQLLSVQEPPRLELEPSGKSWVTIVKVDRAR